MIEFKRAGDVMVFECPSCFIEVSGGSHSIKLNREYVRSSSELLANLEEAFKVLDMMIEHKNKQANTLKVGPDITFDVKRSNPGKVVSEMHVKVNVDTKDAEEAIERINVKLNHETAEQAAKRLFGKGI